MDRERLGRVLGRGARLAARTAYEAVDAATAETPKSTRPPAAPQPVAPQIIPPRTSARATPTRTTPDYAQVAAAAMQGVTAAKQGVAAPLKKASKQLWHEISGCFFALFAFSFFGAVWKTRANAISALPDNRYHFYAFCALTLLFLYFSVSSFLRARRVR